MRMNKETIDPIMHAHVTPTPKSINIAAIRNIVKGIKAIPNKTIAAVPIACSNLFIILFLEIHFLHNEDNLLLNYHL